MELSPSFVHAESDSLNSEQNKALADRFRREIFAEGDLNLTDTILSQDFTAHVPGFQAEWQKGPNGIKRMAAATREAFPDITYTYGLIFARGGKVVLQWTMTGTHQGKIFGVTPTGNSVSVTGTDIYLVSPTGPGGKIVQLWTNWDHWGMLQQLNAIDLGY